MFTIIFFVNRKKYLKDLAITNLSLSEKYQITENIRTAKMLSIFLAELTFVQIILQTLLSIIVFYFRPNKMTYEDEITSNVFDIINAIFSTTFPIPIFLSHRETKKMLLKFFNYRGSKVSASEAKNVIGQNLVLTNNSHDNIRMLQDMWK
uniref:Serpentine receptor class gamma n=1 Tax=Parastrongyloides trichosuri TaxID=131310 RepID=A0A0N5A3Q6_PARTI